MKGVVLLLVNCESHAYGEGLWLGHQTAYSVTRVWGHSEILFDSHLRNLMGYGYPVALMVANYLSNKKFPCLISASTFVGVRNFIQQGVDEKHEKE